MPHSYPTRRSSDRIARVGETADRERGGGVRVVRVVDQDRLDAHGGQLGHLDPAACVADQALAAQAGFLVAGTEGDRLAVRSEEHTSELQLLMCTSYAVFCLEKKQPH